MDLNTISIKDFGPIEQAEVTFDEPLCCVIGNNAQGKTTLINAIRLSLTPRCPNTDKKGGGAMENIRLGAKKADIVLGVLTAAGPFQIRTTYGPGASRRNQTIVAGEGKDDGKGAAGFQAFLERKSEALSCVLDSDYFFNPKTEQKDILAALILPSSHEFEADKVALAEKHLGKFAWDKSPVGLIDQVYGAAYSARRDAKAALSGIYIPQQPLKPEYAAGHVQEKIEACRKRAAAEAKKIKGGGTVQIGRIEQSLEQEKEKLTTAQADYATAIHQRDDLAQAILDQPNVKKADRTAAGRNLWEQLQAQIRELDAEIAAQADAQDVYRELLQDGMSEAHCPTCTQTITRKFIDGKMAQHLKLQQEAEEAKAGLQAEQQALGDITSAEQILAKNAELHEKHEKTKRRVEELEQTISQTEQAVDSASIALDEAKAQESAPADTTALDAANAELSTWEARLSPALNYESTLKQIDEAVVRKQDQTAKVADLETLCSYFGDNGVKADLIAQGAATFMATVNSVLSKWDYEGQLSPEADAFTVLTPKGWLPTKQLSGFELLMFKAALQCAIAVHSKLKIVAIDEVQTMIDDQRKMLFKAIDGMCKEGLLEKAFIILADNRETVPSRAGVAYFRVQDGKVQRL